jgi:hypothetical protein
VKALKQSEDSKAEAETCAKQKTDEFRILSTRHDRLLQVKLRNRFLAVNIIMELSPISTDFCNKIQNIYI